jgi:hypothetical protein
MMLNINEFLVHSIEHASTHQQTDSIQNKFHIGVGYNEAAVKQLRHAMKDFLQ